MKETSRMFSCTRELVRERVREIEEKIKEIAGILSQFGRDGDKIDDPRMYELLEQHQHLRNELSQLRFYLKPEFGTIDTKDLENKSQISVGHQVRLKIAYNDGAPEELVVVIGTRIDTQLLGADERFFKENHLLISEDAPLALSLLNAEEGQVVSFKGEGFSGRVEIIEVKISPLAREK